jgi:charged multivesicular body protein 7
LTPITSSDTSIAHLKTVRLSLTEQISLLTTQSQSLNLKAREALSNKSRILALAALKSRKLTESALQKRSDALSKIEEVLSSVEQSISDAQVLKSLESGASALERLNRDIGGIEKVERIMERVRQGVEQSEDIGRIIAEMGTGARIDDEDVQDEYDEMVKAEEKEKKAAMERETEKEKEAEREKLEREKTEKVVEDLKNVSLNPSEENVEDKRQQQALEGLIAN